MIARSCVCLCLYSAILMVTGCGKTTEPMHPVNGIVRFSDGKLLREGTVEFEIMGRDKPMTARGDIGPDGAFRLGTFTLDDGAVAGQHRVVVISDQAIGNGAERPGMLAQQSLHPKYRDFRTSRLVFDVKEGTNNIVIEVDYASVNTDGEATPKP